MSYFQTRFQGASVPANNALQVKQFMENMKRADEQRRDKAKALAEDQKRLELLAMGHGLEKGEAQSMSRGELSAFIESKSMEVAQGVQQRQEKLQLVKFMQDREIQKQQMDMKQKEMEISQRYADAQQRIAGINENRFLNEQKEQEKQKIDQLFSAGQLQQANQDPNLAQTDPRLSGILKRMPQKDGKFLGTPGEILDRFKGASDQVNKMEAMPSLNQPPKPKINNKALFDTAMKDREAYYEQGGDDMQQKKIRDIRGVLDNLTSGKVETGKFIDFVGGIAQQVLDGEGLSAQEGYELILQEGLRETLGAQFTENEANQFFSRAYNKTRSTEENIKRIKTFLQDRIIRNQYDYDRFKKLNESLTKDDPMIYINWTETRKGSRGLDSNVTTTGTGNTGRVLNLGGNTTIEPIRN